MNPVLKIIYIFTTTMQDMPDFMQDIFDQASTKEAPKHKDWLLQALWELLEKIKAIRLGR